MNSNITIKPRITLLRLRHKNLLKRMEMNSDFRHTVFHFDNGNLHCNYGIAEYVSHERSAFQLMDTWEYVLRNEKKFNKKWVELWKLEIYFFYIVSSFFRHLLFHDLIKTPCLYTEIISCSKSFLLFNKNPVESLFITMNRVSKLKDSGLEYADFYIFFSKMLKWAEENIEENTGPDKIKLLSSFYADSIEDEKKLFEEARINYEKHYLSKKFKIQANRDIIKGVTGGISCTFSMLESLQLTLNDRDLFNKVDSNIL